MKYNSKRAKKANISSRERLGIDVYDAWFLGNIGATEYERLNNKGVTLKNVGRIRMEERSYKQ